MPTEIFISYKREPASHAVALRIKNFVEQALACRVIWDENGLDTGDDIRAYMNRLAQGTYIIFVLSPAFMESPYCMYELSRAGSLEHFEQRAFAVVMPGTSLDHDGISSVIDHWVAKWEAFKGKVEGWHQKNPRLFTPKLQSELSVLEEIAVHSSTALFDLAKKKWLNVDPVGQYNEEDLKSFVQRWTDRNKQATPPVPEQAAPPAKAKKPLPPSLEKLCQDMVLVRGGTFVMGDETGQGAADEQPPHKVKLRDFCIGKYPVTQAQWEAVMGENPSHFKDAPDCPVEQVTMAMCKEFITRLRRKTGLKFRLMTEAEWEYAAGGGENRPGHKYAGGNALKDLGWYAANARERTRPVGQKAPNSLGLYDLCGNVQELCEDIYDKDYYGEIALRTAINPKGPDLGTHYVVRGGCWAYEAANCRLTFRGYLQWNANTNVVGLRLAMDVGA